MSAGPASLAKPGVETLATAFQAIDSADLSSVSLDFAS